MASVSKIAHSRQHHHSRRAAEIPRTQSGRKHLAVYARQLALEPHLQILRRYRRSLLLRLEYAPRPALENHVHRITPVGSWVLINEMWYEARFGIWPCPVTCPGGAEVVRRRASHELQRIP